MAPAFRGANNMQSLWVKNFQPGRDSNLQPDLCSSQQPHLPLGYQDLVLSSLPTAFISATKFTSEREQLKSLKNEEDEREKSLENSKNTLAQTKRSSRNFAFKKTPTIITSNLV